MKYKEQGGNSNEKVINSRQTNQEIKERRKREISSGVCLNAVAVEGNE